MEYIFVILIYIGIFIKGVIVLWELRRERLFSIGMRWWGKFRWIFREGGIGVGF